MSAKECAASCSGYFSRARRSIIDNGSSRVAFVRFSRESPGKEITFARLRDKRRRLFGLRGARISTRSSSPKKCMIDEIYSLYLAPTTCVGLVVKSNSKISGEITESWMCARNKSYCVVPRDSGDEVFTFQNIFRTRTRMFFLYLFFPKELDLSPEAYNTKFPGREYHLQIQTMKKFWKWNKFIRIFKWIRYNWGCTATINNNRTTPRIWNVELLNHNKSLTERSAWGLQWQLQLLNICRMGHTVSYLVIHKQLQNREPYSLVIIFTDPVNYKPYTISHNSDLNRTERVVCFQTNTTMLNEAGAIKISYSTQRNSFAGEMYRIPINEIWRINIFRFSSAQNFIGVPEVRRNALIHAEVDINNLTNHLA